MERAGWWVVGPGKPGGTLLGPEGSGAEEPDGSWVLVFLWLFGCWIVDASIFVAVLLRSMGSRGWVFALVEACLVGVLSSVFVVFVCVATSYEGRTVDALASRADEGRRSLR